MNEFSLTFKLITVMNRLGSYLQPGFVILSPALVVMHVSLQRMLGILPLLLLLIVVPLLLCVLISAVQH